MFCLRPSLSRPAAAVPVAAQLALEASAAGDGFSVRVAGDCMEPFLQDGQSVAVTPGARCWPGDVVAFVGIDGRLRVHRLLVALPARLGGLCITKPDAADWIDAPSPREQVLGRVRRGGARERLRALHQATVLLLRSLGRRARPQVGEQR